jgi:hypothetical protein
MKKTSTPKELQAALDGAGIALENLRTQVAAKAAEIKMLTTRPNGDGADCFSVWVQDIVAPPHEVGETWTAVVRAADGKSYEVDFTVEQSEVKITGDPREVVAKVEYTPVQAGDVPGHDFHGNQYTSGESAKAGNASTKASGDSLKAASSDKQEDHAAAAKSNHDAASAHLLARDKYAKGTKEYDEHNHAIKFHEDRASFHEKRARQLSSAAKPAEASSPAEQGRQPFEAEIAPMSDSANVFNGFMAMAGGIQTMTLGHCGKPVTITLNVNKRGAEALEAQLETIKRAGKQKPFNCFFHEKKAASSWPMRFFWQDESNGKPPGIYEAAEPSEEGLRAVQGKVCRGFSLTFFTNADPVALPLDAGYIIPAGAPGSPENPAEIVCPDDAAENPSRYLNMGTLTNRPASTQNEPLFASADRPAAEKTLPAPVAPAANGARTSAHQPTHTMIKQPLDAEALQARNTQLEQKIVELEAQDTAVAKAQLEAAQCELRENKTKLELAAERKRVAEYEAEKQERIKSQATAAVHDMIESQQIPALDKELQAEYQAKFEKDPTLIPLIVKKGGDGARRLTPGGTAVELQAGRTDIELGFSVPGEMKQLLEFTRRNAAVRISPGMSKGQMEAAYEEKAKWALLAGKLYKKTLAPTYKEWSDIPPQDLAKCVGLDASQAMSFNRRAFEAADYADPNNQFQTLNGTLVLQRTLGLYAYDYPELTSMFTDFSDTPGLYMQTEQSRVVNIPAVMLYNAGLDANGRPIGFVVSSPASTVDAPLTLSAYIAVPIVIGQATLSSTQRRLFDEIAPAGMKAIASYFMGMVTTLLTPNNFSGYTQVTAPDQNGVVQVPVAYATYVKGLSDFSMTDMDKLSAIFTQNKVPRKDRGILLNTQYYAKLRSDPRLEFFFAASKGDPQLTQQKLPEGLSGFYPYEAPYLPSTNNLAFFAYHKAGIMLKSRLPMDYSQAVSALIPGSITTVTEPDSKFSVALVQRVDLVGNYAEWRPEVQLGANVGDKRGGLCGTTQ